MAGKRKSTENYSQLYLFTPSEFTSFRGLLIIAAMKMISLAYDVSRGSAVDVSIPSLFSFVLNPATLYFGPFIDYSQFTASLQPTNTDDMRLHTTELLTSTASLAYSLLFLLISSCLSIDTFRGALGEGVSSNFFLQQFLTAQSYRFSHYFVCYLAEACTLAGGVKLEERVARWERIEWPRSMTDVVVHWNWPMHRFLHKCESMGYTEIGMQALRSIF